MSVFKRLYHIVVALTLIGVILAVGTVAYIFSFYVQNEVSTRDCAVVFGAAVWPGGNPSHALSDRTHMAIDMYEQSLVSCLIFSGADSVYGKHEVDVMRDIAAERGVEDTPIELDYNGRNTRQTIQNLDTSRSYLLISNDFHLARIHLLASQREELVFEVVGSNYLEARYVREPFFIWRELVAFWYYAFRP